jgi:hypothetical protein
MCLVDASCKTAAVLVDFLLHQSMRLGDNAS